MTLDELDVMLARLTAASEAIGANLLELERDPNRKLLDSTSLTGETATRWSTARRTLAAMWDSYARLTELLERAQELRGPRPRISADRVATLEQLLTGDSIEVSRVDVPLGERDLLASRQRTSRSTPDDLLVAMSAQFDEVLAVVVAAGNARDTLVPRLRDVRVALNEVSTTAAGIGEGNDPELSRVAGLLEALGDRATHDPISADGAAFDALEGEVAALRSGFVAADDLRRDMLDRVARARSTVDELRGVVRAADDAHHEVLVKIVAPGVPAPTPVDRDVAAALDAVVALGDAGRWRAAQTALSEWNARVEVLLRRAHETAAANRAPIEERNELRGRLDAYRGMAHATGMLEDPDAARCYERAHDALYTAPTNLHESARLVRAYQDVLSAPAARGSAHDEHKEPR
jgi:hypothetical protein